MTLAVAPLDDPDTPAVAEAKRVLRRLNELAPRPTSKAARLYWVTRLAGAVTCHLAGARVSGPE
jgi:hypothetical protein